MKGRLVGKLLGSIALVILGAVTVWVIDFFAADYFSFLLEKYKVPKEEVQHIFLDAAHRYLAWSGLVAMTSPLSVGFFLIT